MPEKKKEQNKLRAQLERQLEVERTQMAKQDTAIAGENWMQEAFEDLPPPPTSKRSRKAKGTQAKIEAERSKKINNVIEEEKRKIEEESNARKRKIKNKNARKRTKEGKPVMKVVISDLLDKIETTKR